MAGDAKIDGATQVTPKTVPCAAQATSENPTSPTAPVVLSFVGLSQQCAGNQKTVSLKVQVAGGLSSEYTPSRILGSLHPPQEPVIYVWPRIAKAVMLRLA
jgi:hypothetical protein